MGQFFFREHSVPEPTSVAHAWLSLAASDVAAGISSGSLTVARAIAVFATVGRIERIVRS